MLRMINQKIWQGEAAGEQIGVLCTTETEAFYQGGVCKCVGSRSDGKAIARNLYRCLREFDECRAARIYSEAFEAPGIGPAIMNRLLKAAGHRVICCTNEGEQEERR